MFDDQMSNAILGLAKLNFETGLRNMNLYREQAERTIDLASSTTQSVSDETQRTTQNWLAHVKKAAVSYTSAWEAGYRTLNSLVPVVSVEKNRKNAA